MKVFDATGIRNVAFVGHSGAGKTQLISALLFDAGAVKKALENEKFPNVELLSGPTEGTKKE